MSLKLVLVLSLAILGRLTEGKIYSKCEFARTMKSNGITNPRDLGTWTCIAHHESRFDTKAINHDTGDYGILQISKLWWCSDSNTPGIVNFNFTISIILNLKFAGKGCRITCKSLLGDDITPDIKCAKTVFATTTREKGNGFAAWTTYQFCQGDQRSWIAGCGLDHSEM